MLSLSLPPAAHPGRESQLDTLELKPTHSQNEEMLCLSGDETEMVSCGGPWCWFSLLTQKSHEDAEAAAGRTQLRGRKII